MLWTSRADSRSFERSLTQQHTYLCDGYKREQLRLDKRKRKIGFCSNIFLDPSRLPLWHISVLLNHISRERRVYLDR